MDRSRLDHIYYGFESKAAFYNDTTLTRQFLRLNGVPDDKQHYIEAAPSNLDRCGLQVDLVISLIAWGFHFPLSVYLDEVLRALRPGGRIIVDLRSGSDGEELLTSRGLAHKVLLAHPKFRRVCILP
jgi:SAM-dependent methyltransferase